MNIIVRKRPLLYKTKDIIYVDKNTINVYEDKLTVDLRPKRKVNTFKFNAVYSEKSTNLNIYYDNIYKYLDLLLERKNIICYAYGQTGSGKTHTIFGNDKELGMINLTVNDILN